MTQINRRIIIVLVLILISARALDKAVREIYDEGYTFFDYYYVLNRKPEIKGKHAAKRMV